MWSIKSSLQVFNIVWYITIQTNISESIVQLILVPSCLCCMRHQAAAPGYAGFIPSKVAGNCFGKRLALDNLHATEMRKANDEAFFQKKQKRVETEAKEKWCAVSFKSWCGACFQKRVVEDNSMGTAACNCSNNNNNNKKIKNNRTIEQ